MRIAVTYDNGNIFQHFGHTSQFKVYDIENNQIVNEQIIDTQGQGHGAAEGTRLQVLTKPPVALPRVFFIEEYAKLYYNNAKYT